MKMCDCNKLKELEVQLEWLQVNKDFLTKREVVQRLKSLRKSVCLEIIRLNNSKLTCCRKRIESMNLLLGSFSLN